MLLISFEMGSRNTCQFLGLVECHFVFKDFYTSTSSLDHTQCHSETHKPQKIAQTKKNIQPMKTAGDCYKCPCLPYSLLDILAAPVQLKCLFKIRSLRPGFSPPFWAWSGFKYKTNRVIQQFFFKKQQPKNCKTCADFETVLSSTRLARKGMIFKSFMMLYGIWNIWPGMLHHQDYYIFRGSQ